MPLLNIFHLVVTSACLILIYLIQILHYPSFHFVDENKFKAFHAFHSKKITLLVAPLMAVELFTVLYSCFKIFSILNISMACAVFGIWLSTAFIQVPLHNQLQYGKDMILIQRLVDSNWIRTFLWTFEFVLVLFQVFKFEFLKIF